MLRTLISLDVVVGETHTDLDSHADQCTVGSNTLIVHDYERRINVTGYDPTGPVVNDLVTGETVDLIVHQAIYKPELQHNLLSAMQVRLNDVIVNETPRFLTNDITDSIVIPMDNNDKPYVIPLELQGVVSLFATRKPMLTEYESLLHISLTSDDLIYNPSDPSCSTQEQALVQAVLETGDQIGAQPP